MYVVTERTSATSWNADFFSNFLILLGSLLCYLTSAFIILSLKTLICKSEHGDPTFGVFCGYEFLCFFPNSLHSFLCNTPSHLYIYMQASGSIFRSLMSHLDEIYFPALLIIYIVLFCNLKMLLLSVLLPLKIKPYLTRAWKHAK